MVEKETEEKVFPCLKESVRLRREDYCVFCMDRITEKIISLHPSEAVTIALCDGRRTTKEIITIIQDAFSTDEITARRHFKETLQKVEELVENYTSSHARTSPLDPFKFIYNPLPAPINRLPTYSGPLVLVLSITERCNFKCLYCYRGDPRLKGLELKTKEILRVVDEAAQLGVIKSFITGGEPTLRPDLPKIVAHALKADIFPYISTNGYLITDKLAKDLAETGLDTIQVSLDCCDPDINDKLTGVKGSFYATTNAINILKRQNFKVIVKCVVTAINIDIAHEMIDFCHRLGVDTISFSPFFPSTFARGGKELLPARAKSERAIEVITKKKQEYKGQIEVQELTFYPKMNNENMRTCGAMITSIAISPVGDIHLCDTLEGVEEMTIGNVRKMNLKKAWFSQKAEKWRDFDVSKISEPCQSCAKVKICRTGCYNFSKACYGNYYAPDPRCPLAPPLPKDFPFISTSET
nr:radical SAM protein [Candidatus Freyarchaeota archaeon]